MAKNHIKDTFESKKISRSNLNINVSKKRNLVRIMYLLLNFVVFSFIIFISIQKNNKKKKFCKENNKVDTNLQFLNISFSDDCMLEKENLYVKFLILL